MLQNNHGKESFNLYVGSLSRQVQFIQTIPNNTFEMNNSNLIDSVNKQSIRNALSYRFAQNFLDPSKDNFYIPCTPAIEITEIIQERPVIIMDQKQIQLEVDSKILKKGLIKVDPSKYEGFELIRGFQSGIRSAIYIEDGQIYRLKGCGNLNQGFVIGLNVSEDPKSQEIRGCHFYHTVKRELFMTSFVRDILAPFGIDCGNQSIGYIEYDLSQHLDKLEDAFPCVQKYCGVFTTLSDKRLGTHLMQGIQVLLLYLISTSNKTLDLDLLKPFIDKEHRIEQYGYEKLNNQWHISSTYMDLKVRPDFVQHDSKKSLEQGKTFDLEKEHKENLDTLSKLLSQDQKESFFSINVEDKQQQEVLQSLFDNLNIHTDYHHLFNEKLQECKPHQDTILLAIFQLYEKLGYEVGRIKRIFIDNDLNWGYYRDHHHAFFHCNAHLNNFVIIPAQHQNLIAPVDFDLAYRRHEFISMEHDFEFDMQRKKVLKDFMEQKEMEMKPPIEQQQSTSYGKFDEEEWNWYLEAERQSLEMGMTGIEIIINSLMTEIDLSKYGDNKKFLDNLDVLLRDQLRIGYLQGMLLQEPRFTLEYQKNSTLIRNLIEMALILSSDVVA